MAEAASILAWQYWIVGLGSAGVVAIAVLVWYRCWWTAVGVGLGLFTGSVLAVMPLFWLMARAQSKTGVDAGNAGVFLVCLVPVIMPAAMLLGGAIGLRFDRSATDESPSD